MSSVHQRIADCMGPYLKGRDVQLSVKIDDLGLDSLDVMEVLLNIENAFNIEVDVVRFEALETVGDVVAYVSALEGLTSRNAS